MAMLLKKDYSKKKKNNLDYILDLTNFANYMYFEPTKQPYPE